MSKKVKKSSKSRRPSIMTASRSRPKGATAKVNGKAPPPPKAAAPKEKTPEEKVEIAAFLMASTMAGTTERARTRKEFWAEVDAYKAKKA